MSPHQMAPMLAYIGSSTQTPRTYGAQAVFQEGGGMCPTSYLVVSAHGATPWWVGGMPTKHVCSIWPHLVCGTWCACNGRDAVCFTYLGVLPSTPPFGYAVFCILVPRMWGSCHIPKCVVLSLSLKDSAGNVVLKCSSVYNPSCPHVYLPTATGQVRGHKPGSIFSSKGSERSEKGARGMSCHPVQG